MIESGADLKLYSGLHDAVLGEKLELVKVLLQAGVDLNERDSFCGTALHNAMQNGNNDLINLLIESGADLNLFDEIEHTPLHYAVRDNDLTMATFLLSKGANVNAHNEERIGETPLGYIAEECSFERAKLLIDHHADPTIPGWMHLTALDRAQRRKSPEGVKLYELLLAATKKKLPPS